MPEDMESIFDKIMIHYKPVLCLIGSKLILYPHTHADLLRLIFYCLVQGAAMLLLKGAQWKEYMGLIIFITSKTKIMLTNNPTQMDHYNKHSKQGQGTILKPRRNLDGKLV